MKTLLGMSAAGLAAIGVCAYADGPGPLASAEKKIDYLLASWEGQTEEALLSAWGRETEKHERAGSRTLYVFEKVSRARAGFSAFGQVQVSTGAKSCRAMFEVADGGTVIRATRNGDGKTCWEAFKRITPP